MQMICPVSGVITVKKNKHCRVLNSYVMATANQCLHVCTATWDTGANRTVISPAVVQSLGLTKIGTSNASSASHTLSCNKYRIDIILNQSLVFQNVEVIEMDINKKKEDSDILIGMDILCNGDFSVTHLNGETWFSFRVPSQEHIDYSAPVQ